MATDESSYAEAMRKVTVDLRDGIATGRDIGRDELVEIRLAVHSLGRWQVACDGVEAGLAESVAQMFEIARV